MIQWNLFGRRSVQSPFFHSREAARLGWFKIESDLKFQAGTKADGPVSPPWKPRATFPPPLRGSRVLWSCRTR